jgi:hypothetical protein
VNSGNPANLGAAQVPFTVHSDTFPDFPHRPCRMRTMATKNQTVVPPLAVKALADSGLPITGTTLRRHLAAGHIVAQRIAGRWHCTSQAIRDALVRNFGP